MTITEAPFTAAERRRQLEHLAQCWDERGEAVRQVVLAFFASPSLSPRELAQAWQEYMSAQRTADDLEAGIMSWLDFEPDLTCADRQGRACEDAAIWAAGALDVLVYGERRKQAGAA
jgi:hypothetical protein